MKHDAFLGNTDDTPIMGRWDTEEEYDPNEQTEILDTFREMLKGPTGDGGTKRASGTKPSWKIDPDHEAAAFRHIARKLLGETRDPDSGVHPYVHAAWRLLAAAWQEMHAPVLLDLGVVDAA